MPELLEQLASALAGRYVIERRIGAGGMATVYLARDLKHDRGVAVKVLRPDLGVVLGVDRFLAEIRVTANLHHPNLLPLFDSGAAEGLLYFVTPYVGGETLRARVEREKQLPIDEATHIAVSVASALDYAHRHGVIHRDLKPENILLQEGEPLVADFGIALAVSKAGGERITQTGVSLGTPQYMSPEQATGDHVVDGRSDVYSLGVVLYEMLTGEAPHTGATAQAIIAKVLTDTARDVRLLRPHVPDHVATAIAGALEKLPADRWNSARAFAEALAGASVVLPYDTATPGQIGQHPARRRTQARRRRGFEATLGFVAGGLLAAIAAVGLLNRTPRAIVSFVVEPPVINGMRAHVGDLAMSPDGRTLAFIAVSDSTRSVYIRPLDKIDATPMSGTGGAMWISYSPDGKWLSVGTDDGKLLKAAADGSSIVTIGKAGFLPDLGQRGPAAWTADNALVVGGWGEWGRGLFRVSASGVVKQLTRPTDTSSHGLPFITTDGNTLLFEHWGPGFSEDDYLAIGSPDSPSYETTRLLSQRPVGLVDGNILYQSASGTLWAVAFDQRLRRPVGEPRRIMEGMTNPTDVTSAAPSLSPSGTFAYKLGPLTGRIVSIDSAGRVTPLSDDVHRIDLAPGNSALRLSPDGRRIALSILSQPADSTTTDIWVFEVASHVFTRVSGVSGAYPLWAPDGEHLVFTSVFVPHPAVWIQDASGEGQLRKLLAVEKGEQVVPRFITPDRSSVIVCRFIPLKKTVELLSVPLSGDQRVTPMPPSTPHRFNSELPGVCEATLSPDGEWVAFTYWDPRRSVMNVLARRYTGGPFITVSRDGGGSPRWARDGRTLYYLEPGPHGRIWAARLRRGANGLEVVRRDFIAPLASDWRVYDVAPDGRHVLGLQQSDAHVQIVVTTDWTSWLRSRLRAER